MIPSSQQCFYQIDKPLFNYILVSILCVHLNSFLCNLICFVLYDLLLSMSFLILVQIFHLLVELTMSVPHEQMGYFRCLKIYYFRLHCRRIVWRFRHIYFINLKEFWFVNLIELITLLLFRIIVLAFGSSKNKLKWKK